MTNDADHLKKQVIKKMQAGNARIAGKSIIGVSSVDKENKILTVKGNDRFIYRYALTAENVNQIYQA
ncbi:hypothetical protein KKA66_01630 [Patescibacteria group bacterium]|nr:hypothetical protein [Patescibacteria group bacterium]